MEQESHSLKQGDSLPKPKESISVYSLKFVAMLPRLLGHGLGPLLPQCDPDPEPANHLDKGKGEEDAVLETVAAPGGGVVRRVLGVGRRMSHAAARVRVVEWGGGREHEGVEVEAKGDCEADGS